MSLLSPFLLQLRLTCLKEVTLLHTENLSYGKVGSYDVNLSILNQLYDRQQPKGLSADSAVVGTNSNFSSLKFQFF